MDGLERVRPRRRWTERLHDRFDARLVRARAAHQRREFLLFPLAAVAAVAVDLPDQTVDVVRVGLLHKPIVLEQRVVGLRAVGDEDLLALLERDVSVSVPTAIAAATTSVALGRLQPAYAQLERVPKVGVRHLAGRPRGVVGHVHERAERVPLDFRGEQRVVHQVEELFESFFFFFLKKKRGRVIMMSFFSSSFCFFLKRTMHGGTRDNTLSLFSLPPRQSRR